MENMGSSVAAGNLEMRGKIFSSTISNAFGRSSYSPLLGEAPTVPF
jgi:hypothetical protein